MKKIILIIAVISILGAMLFLLTGCGTKEDTTTPDSSTTTNSGNNNKSGSVTIASMKKAAKDAGYKVEDNYPSYWPGVVDGFTITYDNLTTNVVEYKDKKTADENAQKEIEAGYNHPVQNGVFYVIVDIGYNAEITFFENLLNGKTISQNTFID